MTGTRTSRGLQQQLIFGGKVVNQDLIEEDLDAIEEERVRPDGSKKRPSAYVEIFEKTATTVIENDTEMLSMQEINILEAFSKLNYNARYCLIRLVLRKPKQWHPVTSLLKYEKETGTEGFREAIHNLCKPIAPKLEATENQETSVHSVKTEEIDSMGSGAQCILAHNTPIKEEEGPEVIDLTMDSDEEDNEPEVLVAAQSPATLSFLWSQEARTPTIEERIQEVHEQSLDDVNFDFFCEDETVMSLHEILWRLSKDQLIQLMKLMKCKVKSTAKKPDIISALHSNAIRQGVLNFHTTPVQNKGRGNNDGKRQTQLPFCRSRTKQSCRRSPTSQEHRLKQLAVKILGPCIRVNYDFWLLVRRLHIICYRETELPTSLLLPALLTKFKKRDYTSYNHVRSRDIWHSREDYLQYEKALSLSQLLEELAELTSEGIGRSATGTPAHQRDQLVTPAPPGHGRQKTTPIKIHGSVSTPPVSTTLIVKEEDDTSNGIDVDEDIIKPESVITKDHRIKKQLDDWIFPKWQEYVAIDTERGSQAKSPGLERFQSGYIYARMMHKASASLVSLKDHERNLEVIESLLAQRFWRRGKRAAWYERRAIILGHLQKQAADKEKEVELQWKTLDGIKEALLDDDTGTVFRPGLVKRLIALEKKLKVPEDSRSICDGELQPAKSIEIKATRVDRLNLDNFGRPVNANEKENGGDLGLHAYITVDKKPTDIKTEDAPVKRKTGKSVWVGRNGDHVNVETVALQLYEGHGYTGFHCETKILTTIFGLLFWDIIFADVPGAFETPFQAAPLDIFEDSFYYARQDLITQRLEEIRDDKWREILEKHDDAYRQKQTGCIGVSWDLCTKEDLLDIFECIGSQSLAMICQLFCEDYKGRSSGGPDLFVWKKKEGTCKFVEVKGPGDRPQENQKYWFDSLLRSKVHVELCYVKDNRSDQLVAGSSKKRKANTPNARRKMKNGNVSEEEDYEKLDLEPEEEIVSSIDWNMPAAKRRRSSKDEMPTLRTEPQEATTPGRSLPNSSRLALPHSPLNSIQTPSQNWT